MSTTNLSQYDESLIGTAEDMFFDIIVSDWNKEVTFAMCEGAIETLKKHGVLERSIRIVHVPGSFELVYAAKRCVEHSNSDAVIALGCVVRGGTPHFDYVCSGTTNGIANLNAEGKKPVIFGLLTTDNMQQALDRAGGCLGNKGVECAQTAIRMVNVTRNVI